MKRHLSFAVVAGALLVVALHADGTEVALENSGAGFLGSYSAVAIGELDGEAPLDYVFVDESNGSLRIASRLSLLETIVYLTGFNSPNTVAIGDLDGDGDNDLVVGQYNNIPITGDPPYPAEIAEVFWVENPLNGGGDWTAHAVGLLTTEGMRDVELADMDRDGDLDIVEARSGGFSWAANDGTPDDGGWVIHTISSAPSQPWEVEVVDLDGDGDLDIVGSDVTGDELRWYESEDDNANGIPDDFWTSHVIDADLNGAAGVAVGDIDRDGKPDVVAAAAVADRVAWYANPGWTKTEVPYAFNGASSVRAVDLDADGDLDILATAEWADDLAWFENSDGDGASWITWTIDGSFDGAVDAEAGDLDSDGDPDIVAASLSDDVALSLWYNRDVHRRFHGDDSIAIRTSLADPRAIELADLNGDGLQDVITALWNGGAITAYLSLSEGGTLWWENEVVSGFTAARDVSVADVDGDGDTDILGAAVGADAIRWWANDGSAIPAWTSHTVISSYNGAHRVEPADFDGDGDVDLAVAAFDADDVSWMENADGSGTAWTRHDLGTYDGAFDLAVGDLNSDGSPDFVATAYNDDLVEYFLNSPTGGLWSVGQVDSILDGPRGVDLGDLDLDGDLDVVVVVRNDDDILWYENDGTGSGWTAHTVGTGYFPDGAAVRVADLDGDGDLDVAATNQDGNDVFVWENENRASSWTKLSMEQSLDSTWDLDIADIDRDGNPDIAVAAGGTADTLVWYRNLGDQFSQIFYDYAPRVLDEAELREILAVLIGHNGSLSADPQIIISSLRIEFFRADGSTPLTTSEINSMFERLELYRDLDNNAYFTESGDDLAAVLEDLTLVDGVLTWNIPNGVHWWERLVDPSSAEFYFVVPTVTDPEAPVPDSFIARIPAGGAGAVNANFFVPLSSEGSEAVTTDVIFIGYEVFSHGFEIGSTTGWSKTVGD